MAREKEDYRANLIRIDERFPDKELLSLTEVEMITGVDRRILLKDWQREFNIIGKRKLMSKAKLARLIS